MQGGIGAFGKIPAFGDFFRVGPPMGFVPVWDDWLQTRIPAARDRLGARWDSCYLSAPIWRFALGAGLAGPAPAFGVMMPSVDRVGRQFPLTLAGPLPAALAEEALADPIFDRLEDIALEALDDDLMTRETLSARLAGVALPQAATDSNGEAGTGSLWRAETADGPLEMRCPRLPDAAAFTGLFDIGIRKEANPL